MLAEKREAELCRTGHDRSPGWPIPDQYRTRMLQHIAPGLAFKRAVPRMTIYYEDAARVILDNLQYDGSFSRKRVGVALPSGETRAKPNSARTAATG
jgi:hypothetical protein